MNIFDIYLTELNKIKEQQKELNKKMKDLNQSLFNSLGYKLGDLLCFNEKHSKEHPITSDWVFYLI